MRSLVALALVVLLTACSGEAEPRGAASTSPSAAESEEASSTSAPPLSDESAAAKSPEQMLAEALRHMARATPGAYSQVLKEQTSVRTTYAAHYDLKQELEFGRVSARPIVGQGRRYDSERMVWRGRSYVLWTPNCWLDVASLDLAQTDDPELQRAVAGPGPGPFELFDDAKATAYHDFNRDLEVRVSLSSAVELLGGNTVLPVGLDLASLRGTAPAHVDVTDGQLRTYDIIGAEVRKLLKRVAGVEPRFLRYLEDATLAVRMTGRVDDKPVPPEPDQLALDAQSGCATAQTA